MASELRVTLADHAAGNYRVLMNLADELLAVAADRDLPRLDESSSSRSSRSPGPDRTAPSSMEIDPMPYAQPGAYYDPSGNPVGPQGNPFGLVVTSLYADSSHAGQWATRTVSGVQQWGTFSSPLNVLGTTVYQYVSM